MSVAFAHTELPNVLVGSWANRLDLGLLAGTCVGQRQV